MVWCVETGPGAEEVGNAIEVMQLNVEESKRLAKAPKLAAGRARVQWQQCAALGLTGSNRVPCAVEGMPRKPVVVGGAKKQTSM
eukprot:scaffold120509_cov20-Tisochrysis_lutea.AAC.1